MSQETLRTACQTAEELRRRGEHDQAAAIDALVEVARENALPSLDLLTSTEAGELIGVSGQTIKNWVRQGQLQAYRIGGRFMIPKDEVADYVRRARQSLELEELSDEQAAKLVEEGRRAD